MESSDYLILLMGRHLPLYIQYIGMCTSSSEGQLANKNHHWITTYVLILNIHQGYI